MQIGFKQRLHISLTESKNKNSVSMMYALCAGRRKLIYGRQNTLAPLKSMKSPMRIFCLYLNLFADKAF